MSALRIAHVITGLGAGGAEATLVKLLARLDRARFSSTVTSLLAGGVNDERLRSLDIPVRSLELRRGVPDLRGLLALARALARERPDVVQTWMYHADVVGGLAARAAHVPAVVWNLRNSDLAPHSPTTTRLALALGAALSRLVPDAIISCSLAGIGWHVARGYPSAAMRLIENGFDTERFRPDEGARLSLRRELGIGPDDAVVTLAARYAPEKDHPAFLDAIASLRAGRRRVTALLCGEGVEPGNAPLARDVEARGLGDVVRLLGRRDDMERVFAASDVACSSSSHVEGLSNALGEAMAAGVPCVATDVGDARRLVGDTGVVVPAGDARALAQGVALILDEPDALASARRQAARARVEASFSIDACVARYADLYLELAQRVRHRRYL